MNTNLFLSKIKKINIRFKIYLKRCLNYEIGIREKFSAQKLGRHNHFLPHEYLTLTYSSLHFF